MNIDTHGSTVTYGADVLEPVAGSLSLDRTRVPFATGSVTVQGGYSIDPREGERVRLAMRQDFASADDLDQIDVFLGGADLDTIDASIWNGLTLNQIDASFAVPYDGEPYRMRTRVHSNLGVRRAEYNVVRNETTVQLASDEALAEDYKSILTYDLGFGTDLRTTVSQALRYIGATLAPGSLTFTLETAPVWEPGESLWSFLSPLVTAAGLILYSDHTRLWWLVNPDTGQPGQVTLSDDAQITEAVATIDREADEWADGVVVKYTWTDALGATQVRFDTAAVPAPTKVIEVTYERTRYPGPGAAAAILNRIARRGRQVPVTAINDYTARPGMAVALGVTALGEIQQGKVKAVQWAMLTGDWEMNLDAYDLEALVPDAMNAFPAYVMMNALTGMMNTLNPGDY